MRITGEDAFFLTFISAWLSVRISTWGIDNIPPLIILILSIFFYTLLISWIRDCLKRKKLYFSLYLLIFIVGMLISIILLASTYPDYLKTTDVTLLITMAILWLIMTFFEKLDFNIQFKNNSILDSTENKTETQS